MLFPFSTAVSQHYYITYQPEIQLSRSALQKNTGYWSVEKKKKKNVQEVLLIMPPSCFSENPPQSHSLWVSSCFLLPFSFFVEKINQHRE